MHIWWGGCFIWATRAFYDNQMLWPPSSDLGKRVLFVTAAAPLSPLCLSRQLYKRNILPHFGSFTLLCPTGRIQEFIFSDTLRIRRWTKCAEFPDLILSSTKLCNCDLIGIYVEAGCTLLIDLTDKTRWQSGLLWVECFANSAVAPW